jgi:hypothetical protein
MSQPGSIFHQARPQPPSHHLYAHRDVHGFEAFSAHMAAEMGDSPGLQNLFTSLYDGETTLDSGDETETERERDAYTNVRRQRRRSSFFADKHNQRQPQTASRTLGPATASTSSDLTPDQLHTASLGLHRSFSLASFQHFLLGSVYESLPSSMVAAPRTPTSLNISTPPASPFQAPTTISPGSELRRRTGAMLDSVTHSEQSLDGSLHSPGDLESHSTRDGTRDYSPAVSYWRRILRSLIF